MNDLAIVVERYGRVGAIERLLPEFITPTDGKGGRTSTWSSSVGMVKVNRIEDLDSRIELPNEILASIIVTQEEKKAVDLMEFHGVIFFKPLDGMRWDEQIQALRTKPSMFEVVPVTRIHAGQEYAFFARRAAKGYRSERKAL